MRTLRRHNWPDRDAAYPGGRISLAETPALANAAKASLLARGGTGDVRERSFAWRTTLYARLHDSDDAHGQTLHLLATEAALPNLIGNHPPHRACARGEWVVDMARRGGKLTGATLHSTTGTRCRVRCGVKAVTLTLRPGATVHLGAGLITHP